MGVSNGRDPGSQDQADEALGRFDIRCHGDSPPRVACLHGGPGGGAGLGQVSEPLAAAFGTLDYVQRRSGNRPLSVAVHVEDLRQIIAAYGADEGVAIVGASWGAMLALAFAAAHPSAVVAAVLVGCGTFDEASRAKIDPIRQSRIRPEHHSEIERLTREIADPIERMGAIHELTSYVDSFDPLPPRASDAPMTGFDARGFEQTWGDMVQLQEQRIYPAAFTAITCPVLMIHGDYDPHPGAMIRDSLLPHIGHLEYTELPRCGHEPWCERHARDPFFKTLTDWLSPIVGES